jgi:cytochrome c-type biogenesis protein CcmE
MSEPVARPGGGVKPATIVGLVIILGALAYGAKAFITNLTPYVPFQAARKATGQVQVMGKLDKTTIQSGLNELAFVIVDASGDRMPVTFTAARPANFEMATEITAIGKYDGQIFRAKNLLVKCPTKYQGTETKSYAGK